MRFYADEGLFGKLPRTAKGYRDFPEDAGETVAFILDAQGCGFTLAEIRLLLQVQEGDPGACVRVGGLVNQKLVQLDLQLERITALRERLATLGRACAAAAPDGPCPVVGGLGRSPS